MSRKLLALIICFCFVFSFVGGALLESKAHFTDDVLTVSTCVGVAVVQTIKSNFSEIKNLLVVTTIGLVSSPFLVNRALLTRKL